MKIFCTIVLCALFLAPATAQDARAAGEKLKEARALLFDQEFEPALAKFDEILKVDPNNLEAYLGKMNALGSLRKTQEVQKMAIAKTKAQTSESLIIDANRKIWERDYKGALGVLTQAQKKGGTGTYMADYLAGYVHYRSRANDQALHYLLQAVEKNKDYPESYYLLGDIYMKKKDANNTIKYWNEYLKRVPKSGKRYKFVNNTLQKMRGN